MTQIYYKTSPRLFLLSIYLTGFVFFALLSRLVFESIQVDTDLSIWILFVLFVSISVLSLFALLKIKTIKLSKDRLIVSRLLLPSRQTYKYADIKSITQDQKKVKGLYGASFRTRYIFADLTTTIHLADKKIRTNSVGQLDFDSLAKCFRKLKNKEGKCNTDKTRLAIYLLDNLDGLFFVILFIVLTCGLAYNSLGH